MASQDYYKIIEFLNNTIGVHNRFLRSDIEELALNNNIKSSDVDKVIDDITKIHYFDNGQQGWYADRFGEYFIKHHNISLKTKKNGSLSQCQFNDIAIAFNNFPSNQKIVLSGINIISGKGKTFDNDFIKKTILSFGNCAVFDEEFELLANVPYRICDGWKYKTLELEAANVSCIPTQYDPLVELNRSNFNIVSNLISISPSHQVNLTECVFNSFNSTQHNQKQFLLAMMRVIDFENSTNAWDVHDSREQIFKVVDWIVNNYSSFINKLQAGDKYLPDLLLTEPFNSPTTKIKSLVSKFCKYLNEYLWVNLPNTQRFFINDSFIRAMLPYYYKQYVNPRVLLNIDIVNNYSYVQLFDKLEEIRIAANKINNSNLSRSEMDQIIWYCYRKYEK